MIEGSVDTERIERELDDTRSRLDTTIGALQRKLAPATMVDQAIEFFTEGGGMELGRTFGRSVRDNPIPVALIGVGLGWLMFSSSRRDSDSGNGWQDRPWMREDRFGGEIDQDRYGRPDVARTGIDRTDETSVHQPMPYEAAAYDDLATKAYRAGKGVERQAGEADDSFLDRVDAARGTALGLAREAGEAAASFRQRVEQALSDAVDKVQSFAAGAGDKAEQLAAQGRSVARDVYDYGRSTTADMRRRAGSMAGEARSMSSRTVDYMQDQPLLLGALGVTVGAAIGLLVPASRQERRVVGAMRENLMESAREAVGEAGQRATRAAQSVIGTAQEAARREGFEPVDRESLVAATRGRVADVAGRARQVVEETGAAGVDAVRREFAGDSSRPQRDAMASAKATGTAVPHGAT